MLTGQVWISEAGKVMEGSRGFQRPDIKEVSLLPIPPSL